MKPRLTLKQEDFVRNYVLSGNSTDAARKAGYKEPKQTGYENLTKPYLKAAVDAKRARTAVAFGTSAKRVLEEVASIALNHSPKPTDRLKALTLLG